MVIKHENAVNNLKPLVAYCVEKAVKTLDMELRDFVWGEDENIVLSDVFDDKDKQNMVLRLQVVENLMILYKDAGWEIAQASDDEYGNVVLTFK